MKKVAKSAQIQKWRKTNLFRDRKDDQLIQD
jgi:hypothetical protein